MCFVPATLLFTAAFFLAWLYGMVVEQEVPEPGEQRPLVPVHIGEDSGDPARGLSQPQMRG